MIGQLCLDAHLPKRSARHTSQRVSKSVPLSILYLFMIILFLKLELSTIFSVYSIYQCIFSLDVFISSSEASVLIARIQLFCTP